MFGIGLPELIVIFVIALLVLGPDRLPQVARTLGRGIKELRRISQDIKDEIEEDTKEVEEEVKRTHRAVSDHDKT